MGWPVAWLQEIISAEEFDKWCVYHRHYPLDDQSNHHYPIAQLEATLMNINRSEHGKEWNLFESLIFKRPDTDSDIESQLAEGNW